MDDTMAILTINADQPQHTINHNLYGQFAEHLGRCIYEGLYVGENSQIPNRNGMRTDVVEALKQMKIPVLRWPGGCFADTYHWKDGIGPKESRKKMINVHWGGMVEDNSFGTHEFFELCRQLGCEPYINGNVGSGTVQEMQEWIEYMTFDGVSPMAKLREENGRKEPWKVKYFGVGNENWGCGGFMRPQYYADLYRRFSTYCLNYGDNKLYKIACGPNRGDYEWTRVLMREAAPFMDGLTLHYYSYNKKNRSATQFGEAEWAEMLKDAAGIEEEIVRHTAIMDEYDPQNRIGLLVDEWGAWHDEEPGTVRGFLYQRNTMRDAVLAGLSLNIFNRHSRRVQMANIAQLVNVLQAPILTDGAKMVRTPTYYVFEMYAVHQDAKLLDAAVQTPDYTFGEITLPKVSVSSSLAEDGAVNLTLCNLSPNESESVTCELRGKAVQEVAGRVLTAHAMNAGNDFEAGETVKPMSLPVTLNGDVLSFTLPAKSVAAVTVR